MKNICKLGPYTNVLTNKGWKNITDVDAKNEVVNLNGEWERILKIEKNKPDFLYKVTYYNITEDSISEIYCTEDSVICTYKNNKIIFSNIKNVNKNDEVPLIYAYINRFPRKEIIQSIEKTTIKDVTYTLQVGKDNAYTIKDNILI